MNVLKNIFQKKKKDGSREGYSSKDTKYANGGSSPEVGQEKVTKDDFDSLKLLGKGSFAKVVLVRKKDNRKIFAMKVIVKESVLQHQRVQDVFTERGVLLRSNHPFLCKLHWTFQSEHKLFFIMDYYHGGDLDGHLNRQPNKKVKPSTGRLYSAEVLLALMYLHENGIIYRDLKPENILMGADGHPCLSDFGLSKDFGAYSLDDDARTASFVGSPYYVAPDVLRQKQYTSAIDWWSFGILLFRMLVSRPPFLGMSTFWFWLCNKRCCGVCCCFYSLLSFSPPPPSHNAGSSMKQVFDNILYQELRFSQVCVFACVLLIVAVCELAGECVHTYTTVQPHLRRRDGPHRQTAGEGPGKEGQG